MFFERLIRFARGYVLIEVNGKFPERFLNVCALRKIYVCDVTYLSKSTVRLLMSLKAYEEVPEIAKKTFVDVKEISRGGLPVFLNKYQKRKWFFICPVIVLFALIVLNMFVWEIEIIGNENVPTEEIRQNLETLGVKEGAPRFTIDEKKVKNEMLIKMPSLSWLWTDKKGSKIIVNVRESVPKPDMFDKTDYCNIVATKDGIIDSVIVRSGSFMFALGDTVQKDDILVSGLMLSERNIEPRQIQADADIFARVWYEKTQTFPLFETKNTETGNVSKKRKVKLFGWEFMPFWYKEPTFSLYTTETKTFEPTIFNKYLGVKVQTDVFKEYTQEEIPLTEETVIADAVNVILEEIDKETSVQSRRVNHTFSHKKNDDNTISVTVVCEYIENIAKKVRLDQN